MKLKFIMQTPCHRGSKYYERKYIPYTIGSKVKFTKRALAELNCANKHIHVVSKLKKVNVSGHFLVTLEHSTNTFDCAWIIPVYKWKKL